MTAEASAEDLAVAAAVPHFQRVTQEPDELEQLHRYLSSSSR
ncbi:hypothetical protein [Nocardia sp. NPDC004260]